jgi:adenylate cyclase
MGAKVAAVAKQSQDQAVRAESVVMFAELRNFTRMSEMLEPTRVLALADQFFDCAAGAVAAHGGEIVGVHNDSLMGAFDAIVQAWERDYGLRTAIALGVHRGEAVYGEAGPAAQRNAVVFGDCVSIAERLVHRARAGELVLSDAIMSVVSVAELELDAQPLPPLELHNRPSIRIYGVLRNDRLDFTA